MHPVATGWTVALPGTDKPFFDKGDWDRLLRRESGIGPADAGPVRLAARRGAFDLTDWGVPARFVEAMEPATQYAVAAGFEALKAAGLDGLPEELRDGTGIVFASAFAGAEAWLNAGAEGPGAIGPKFLLSVMGLGHAQAAQALGARGPTLRVDAASASTTAALCVAHDWLRTGRAERVLVLGADDATSDTLLPWVAGGFAAAGAAATDERVEDAALPFDARRHGTIVGMGALGILLETPESAAARGATGPRLLASRLGNSAFHGTRASPDHWAEVLAATVQEAATAVDTDPAGIGREGLYVAHETFTPAATGSSTAEAQALRTAFGDAAAEVTVTSMKAYTGHPQGANLEDAAVLEWLTRGVAPGLPDWVIPDPALGALRFADGTPHGARFGIRLGAGFGSQVAALVWQRK